MKITDRPHKWNNVERMSNYLDELDNRIFVQYILLAIAITGLVAYTAHILGIF